MKEAPQPAKYLSFPESSPRVLRTARSGCWAPEPLHVRDREGTRARFTGFLKQICLGADSPSKPGGPQSLGVASKHLAEALRATVRGRSSCFPTRSKAVEG